MPCLPSSVTTARVRALTSTTLATARTLGARPLLAQPETLAASDTIAPSAPVVDRGPVSSVTSPAGPTQERATVAARVHRAERRPTTTDARQALAPASHPHAGPAVALMLVGATAIVLGLVVSGNAQAPLI